MDDLFFKRQFKFNGLNHNIDLERDKVANAYEDAITRHQKAQEQKRELLNRHFDPIYMEINLPDPPSVSGGISFDPDDMIFDL